MSTENNTSEILQNGASLNMDKKDEELIKKDEELIKKDEETITKVNTEESKPIKKKKEKGKNNSSKKKEKDDPPKKKEKEDPPKKKEKDDPSKKKEKGKNNSPKRKGKGKNNSSKKKKKDISSEKEEKNDSSKKDTSSEKEEKDDSSKKDTSSEKEEEDNPSEKEEEDDSSKKEENDDAKKEEKDSNTPKKGPGRPRKTPKKEPLLRLGISESPKNEENSVELEYDNPIIFKKLFSMLKLYSTKGVRFNFYPKYAEIIATDHEKKNIIKIIIHGSKLNHYYCEEFISETITRISIDKIFQKIDKSYDLISFVCKKRYKNDKIFIGLNHYNMKVDEEHILEVTKDNSSNDNMDEMFDTSECPIKLKIQAKYFKKIINDASAISNTIKFVKVGTYPLTIEYDDRNHSKIRSKVIFTDDKIIHLESTIKEEDIFYVSVKTDYIRPFSNPQIGEYISISIHKTVNLIFSTEIDTESEHSTGVFTLQILTETENLKEF